MRLEFVALRDRCCREHSRGLRPKTRLYCREDLSTEGEHGGYGLRAERERKKSRERPREHRFSTRERTAAPICLLNLDHVVQIIFTRSLQVQEELQQRNWPERQTVTVLCGGAQDNMYKQAPRIWSWFQLLPLHRLVIFLRRHSISIERDILCPILR